MQVLLDEAKSAYKEDIITELQNNNADDMENNLKKIITWINNFIKENEE
jgi:adenylate kinase